MNHIFPRVATIVVAIALWSSLVFADSAPSSENQAQHQAQLEPQTQDRSQAISPESTSIADVFTRAQQALRERDYKGRFTYEFGSVLETLEVVHAVRDGVEYERILHLSGKKREFVRSGRSMTCMTIGALLSGGEQLNVDGKVLQLSEHYHFHIGNEQRVAGREARVVQVVPNDEYRYSLTFAFDESTGLPLMSLLGTQQSTIERFQFVDIEVGDSVSDADLKATDGGYQILADGSQLKCIPNSGLVGGFALASQSWSASWVPPGFTLSQADSSENYEAIYTYTDGLAAFTIFIADADPLVPDGFRSGAARRGATLVLMSAAQYGNATKSIALVGEVPLLTAKRVLASIRPPEGNAATP